MTKTKKTFEESMNRLEEIVRLLEEEEQPLDEKIKLFEEGLKLTKECNDTLKGYEEEVEKIVKDNKEDE